MTPGKLKTFVLDAVKRAASSRSVVKFYDVSAAVPAALSVGFTNRDLDRALQMLRREGAIQHLSKRDPKTDKPRKRWGWQPVAKRGARRG